MPVVATFHASGELGWARMSIPVWGFLLDRIDARIAVSEQASASASRYSPAGLRSDPERRADPAEADPAGENRILFVGRQEARKGLSILLRAWPEIRRRTGATLRVIGADPLAVRLLMAKPARCPTGSRSSVFLPQERLTEELLGAKAMAAPSLGGELEWC